MTDRHYLSFDEDVLEQYDDSPILSDEEYERINEKYKEVGIHSASYLRGQGGHLSPITTRTSGY